MAVPDKLPYTRGEKIAEILCGVLAAGFSVVMIILMALGITDGANIIMLVCLLIIYAVFSVCSVYPQGSNLFSKPEKISDKGFHAARRGCIIAKAVLMTAIFVLSLPFFSVL